MLTTIDITPISAAIACMIVAGFTERELLGPWRDASLS